MDINFSLWFGCHFSWENTMAGYIIDIIFSLEIISSYFKPYSSKEISVQNWYFNASMNRTGRLALLKNCSTMWQRGPYSMVKFSDVLWKNDTLVISIYFDKERFCLMQYQMIRAVVPLPLISTLKIIKDWTTFSEIFR